MKKYCSTAFTLTELMIVIIILGIIVGFALPNYQKSLQKAYEKDAIIQLQAIKAANQLYQAQTGDYLVGSGFDLDDINSNLRLNILSNNMTYTYESADGSDFLATASWVSGSNNFTIQIDELPMSTSNPCCVSANCLTLTSDLADC